MPGPESQTTTTAGPTTSSTVAPSAGTPAASSAGASSTLRGISGYAAQREALRPRSAPAAPISAEAGPMEVVAASTQGQFSDGRFTARILRLMRSSPGLRFVDAARRVSREGQIDRDQRPMGSADVTTQELLADPPLRRAVVFAMSDYAGSHDLPEVDEQTRPGGSLRRALEGDYGRGNVAVVRNPRGATIEPRIRAEVDRLAGELAANQTGELMINMQGHGGSGTVDGVDWRAGVPDGGRAISEYAQSRRVHIVMVSDSCDQGGAVSTAQGRTHRELAGRIERSGLPESERASLNAMLHDVRPLNVMVQRIRTQMTALRDLAEGRIPMSQAESTLEDLRGWLRINGGSLTGAHETLSGTLSSEMREVHRAIVQNAPRIRSHDDARAILRQLTSMIDHLTEETTSVHETVNSLLQLGRI
jgi:hypothetical protein